MPSGAASLAVRRGRQLDVAVDPPFMQYECVND